MQDETFRIRQAALEDLSRMLEIYAHARQFMAEHGNPRQWGATGWPPEWLLRQDIGDGHSYVCEAEGRVVGTFFYACGPHIEPAYETIVDGRWIGEEVLGEAGNTYGVIHRIASDGSKKGTGGFCIQWAYRQCGHLRVDTHRDNLVMQNLMKKLGFVPCGTIYVEEDNDPRIAFEKLQL